MNNSHQFKDDPEYGQILKRMWDGKFSQQDCSVNNERLIGHKLQLPDFDDDADVAYAFWRNSKRVLIHASTFQKHIDDFPSVESDDDPPNHTVTIETDIRRASKCKPKKKEQISDDCLLPARVTYELSNKIYARCRYYDMNDHQKQILFP